jgi:hypothetical protein
VTCFCTLVASADDSAVSNNVAEKTKEKMMIEYIALTKTIFKKDFYSKNDNIEYADNKNNVADTTEKFVQLCYQITRSNKSKLYSFNKMPRDEIKKSRLMYANEILDFRHSICQNIDKDFDFSITVYRNIHFPGYEAGGESKVITNLDDRKKYEAALWKNNVNAWQLSIQRTLTDCNSDLTEVLSKFFINAYGKIPRDDDELVELLNKYEYPEAEKAKIFRALNIPYNGFREWRTNDGLLTLMAKLISADKKEVKLEKEDGKKFTIEIAYLRKEDQDYVKKQLEPEPKTPTDKKEDKKTNN